MEKKLFLYIDILGFSNLVETNTAIIDDLYNVVASLNVHDHHSFKTIVFSDTILIYNEIAPITQHDWEYLVMYLCEFAQDLQHRLSGRNITFRAIITYGEFCHYVINEVPCFYGKALINAYQAEKEIKCTGLFISNECNLYNEIFKTNQYNDKLNFVYLTQALEELEYRYDGAYPIESWILESTELCWRIAPEIVIIKDIYHNMKEHKDGNVREKCENTIGFYQERYPKTMALLVASEFDLKSISPELDWSKITERIPEDFSWIRKK